jgi:zinc protease
MFLRLFLSLCAGLTFVSASYAAIEDQVSEFMLDNGMQVVVIEDHRAPVVVHMVWYRAGAADENLVCQALRIFWNIFCSKKPKT